MKEHKRQHNIERKEKREHRKEMIDYLSDFSKGAVHVYKKLHHKNLNTYQRYGMVLALHQHIFDECQKKDIEVDHRLVDELANFKPPDWNKSRKERRKERRNK